MHRELEAKVERMCERERVVASARAAAMSELLQYLRRLRAPLAYEAQRDSEEDQEGNYR
jgi:hypothetical protein